MRQIKIFVVCLIAGFILWQHSPQCSNHPKPIYTQPDTIAPQPGRVEFIEQMLKIAPPPIERPPVYDAMDKSLQSAEKNKNKRQPGPQWWSPW